MIRTFHCDVDGREIEIGLQDPEGEILVAVDGRRVQCAWEPIDGNGLYCLFLDGRVFEFQVEEIGAGEFRFFHRGRPLHVRTETAGERAIRSASPEAADGGGETVVSPMPGLILNVAVEEGAGVKTGDLLLIMEAMKMENEIRAKSAGHVSQIHVKAGETVSNNAPLVTITP